MEAAGCGGAERRGWRVLLSFVSRAYFRGRSLLPLSQASARLLRRERREEAFCNVPGRNRDRVALLRYMDARENKKSRGGSEAQDGGKEPMVASGDEGGLDGIRGMSCNNRAAIRANVLTTGGATARPVSLTLIGGELASSGG